MSNDIRPTRLLIDNSEESKEGMELLMEAGIQFRRVPANGNSMPVLLIGNAEYVGLEQIRLHIALLRGA